MYTSQGKQNFEMRKLLVSFLNGSLKYHADVIAGRQIHQNCKLVRIKLIRHVNPAIDSQVLLLHGISEKNVILHEAITSSKQMLCQFQVLPEFILPFLSTSLCP